MTFRPKRGFRVGRMRHRITIEEATTDESSGQPARDWNPKYKPQPAQYTPTTGGETINGKIVEAGISAVFTIRKRADLSSRQRVVHGSQTYGVSYVHPVEGGERYVDLHCKAIANA